MNRNDNGADYFGFPLHPVFNVTGLSLFFQIRDEFEAGSSIVTPDSSQLYFKNIFYYFIVYFNINNNNN